jgi:hypothetical protein
VLNRLDDQMAVDTALLAWVGRLRDRLARGELAGLGPLDAGGVALPGELFVRIMLADLQHHDDLPPRLRRDPFVNHFLI